MLLDFTTLQHYFNEYEFAFVEMNMSCFLRDEHVKVRTTEQPAIINEACGIYYNQFTVPQHVSLTGDPCQVGAAGNEINTWMELITPTTAKVLAYYDHPVWGKYAAITENNFGKALQLMLVV